LLDLKILIVYFCKIKFLKKFIKLFAVLFFFAFPNFLKSESPTGIVVSPLKINFSDEFGNLKTGSSYQSKFEVQNTTDEDLKIVIVSSDGKIGDARESWIKILEEDQNFTLGSKENSNFQNSKVINFVLEIPKDAKESANELLIVAKTDSKDSGSINFSFGVGVKIKFNVSDTKKIISDVSEIKILSEENGKNYEVSKNLKFNLGEIDFLKFKRKKDVKFLVFGTLQNNSKLFSYPDIKLDSSSKDDYFLFSPEEETKEFVEKISQGRSEEEVFKIISEKSQIRLSAPNLFYSPNLNPQEKFFLDPKEIYIKDFSIFKTYKIKILIYENGEFVGEKVFEVSENLWVKILAIGFFIFFVILVVSIFFIIFFKIKKRNEKK